MEHEQLMEEREAITRLVKQLEVAIAKAPQGRLRSEMNQGKYPQYYYSEKEEHNTAGRYLRKNELGLAQKIAQKEYDRMVLQCLKEQERKLNLLEKTQVEAMEEERLDIYRRFPTAKQLLIKPYFTSDEDFLKQWYEMHQGEQNSFPMENEFLTEQGERVRSKSEKMIADKLFYMKIPYRYESALYLSADRSVYPDFTILNRRTRKTYYLEHFGMMDHPDYCKKAIEKMELYEKHGIYLNEQLLITMECSLKGINMQSVDNMIRRYLM